jgi:microcin C transport system permease protein
LLAYIVRRLLLMLPTLLGVMIINFAVVQVVPGGPVEQLIAEIQGTAAQATARISGSSGEIAAGADGGGEGSTYRGAQGLDPEFIADLERTFGLDRPAHERFLLMMRRYLTFDFGESYFQNRSVVEIVLDKMPVSISLGLWTTFLVYLVSIPLGIGKAVRDGSPFDVWTSVVIIVGQAIPSFLFAILLVVLFAGGSFVQWFPLRGLASPGIEAMPWWTQVVDYLWHLALPLTALLVGSFATLTMLTKNSFLEEINKLYVATARAKGLSRNRVLYGHVFRNAMLIVIAGFPGTIIGILFTGALTIEIIFSLDGLGLLGFESAIRRDYPIMFATLYFFTLLGLVMRLIGDLVYVAVDPRIDFERRGA